MVGIPFTLLAGTLLGCGFDSRSQVCGPRLATFFVSFLAVQCILNALLDLKTVFFLSIAICAVRADGCREHGKRHRRPSPCLGHNLDLYRIGNSGGRDATLHIR